MPGRACRRSCRGWLGRDWIAERSGRPHGHCLRRAVVGPASSGTRRQLGGPLPDEELARGLRLAARPTLPSFAASTRRTSLQRHPSHGPAKGHRRRSPIAQGDLRRVVCLHGGTFGGGASMHGQPALAREAISVAGSGDGSDLTALECRARGVRAQTYGEAGAFRRRGRCLAAQGAGRLGIGMETLSWLSTRVDCVELSRIRSRHRGGQCVNRDTIDADLVQELLSREEGAFVIKGLSSTVRW